MTIQTKIKDIKDCISKQLVPLINSDYIFLDLPYYSNIGDTLIWKGTEAFLSTFPYKCLGRASFQTFQFPKLAKDVVIVMMGGGNWGDLYAPHNQLRREVVIHYPNNRIIILPQTVYYDDARNVVHDANIFRKHKNLIICARDKYSYRFLKAFAFSKNVLLVPDMVFCIDNEVLNSLSCKSTDKDLVFKREDKEKSSLSFLDEYLSGRKYDVSDWPFYEGGDPKAEKLYSLMKAGRLFDADKYALETYLPMRFKEGVEHISKYERVFSNRLHGALLSILLGKEVYIIDNSYGKNSQYYNTWLKDTTNVHLLTTHSSFNLKRKIKFFLYCVLSQIMRLVK